MNPSSRSKCAPNEHFYRQNEVYASRPSGGHPATDAEPGQGHRRRDRHRTRGVGGHRPPRSRGAVGGGDPGVSAAGTGRRVAVDRWCPHRSERADRRRGAGIVPARGPIGGRPAGSESGTAQARACLAADLPRRGRSRRRCRRHRPITLGRHRTRASRRGPHAATSCGAAQQGSPELPHPHRRAVRAPGRPTGPGRQGWHLVSRRRHRARQAHLPCRPDRRDGRDR